jgi:FlaA1/EpsC-like NDP-sugar epimerase
MPDIEEERQGVLVTGAGGPTGSVVVGRLSEALQARALLCASMSGKTLVRRQSSLSSSFPPRVKGTHMIERRRTESAAYTNQQNK